MNKILSIVLGAALLPAAAFAAGKTYQVTGPVLEVRPDAIVVQKGKDKWEIATGAGVAVPAEAKVGAKVTIEYTMTATSIEVKGEKAKAEKPAKAKKKQAP